MWIGAFLIVVGILVILNNMEILRGDVWDYVWPLFFIMLGVSLIIKRTKKNPGRSGEKGEAAPPKT